MGTVYRANDGNVKKGTAHDQPVPGRHVEDMGCKSALATVTNNPKSPWLPLTNVYFSHMSIQVGCGSPGLG